MLARVDMSDDVRLQSASLAFALLRFAAGAAHPDPTATPKGMLRTGTECYLFTPSWNGSPSPTCRGSSPSCRRSPRVVRSLRCGRRLEHAAVRRRRTSPGATVLASQ